MLPEWLRRWPQSNPLAILALAAIAGLLVADAFRWQPGFWLAAIGVLALTHALWRPRLWNWLPVAFIAFAYLHTLRLSATHGHPLRERLLAAPEWSERAVVRARLFPWLDGVELDEARAGATVAELRWENEPAFQPVSMRTKVVLPEGQELREPGLYELSGVFYLPRPPIAPGQFDGSSYSLRMGWVGVLKADQVRLIQAEPSSLPFHLLRWAENCRQWMIAVLSRGVEEDERGKAVMLAMALGASSAAGDDVEEAFRDSGTLHVFAVSGLHVVMVATVVGLMLHWLGIGRVRSAWLLILLVFVYAYVTGWRPSAARAALMVALMFGAPLLNRQTALQNSLGAAALLLLAYDTHQLFLPGFQLSFGVLWAIALAATWLMDRMRWWTQLDPFLPPVLANRRQRAGGWARKWVASTGSVSTAAWMGSLPLILGHFRTLTPVALIANFVLVPLSSFCIAFACMSVFFAAIGFGPGQVLMNKLNASFSHGMVRSASWFAKLPMANFYVRVPRERPPVEMRVVQLSGGGAANHLRSGDTHWLLDCGNEDAWRRVVLPYLRVEGVNHLQGLILSHGDSRHIGAAPKVLTSLGVKELHTSLLEPGRYQPPGSSFRQLVETGLPDGLWRKRNKKEVIVIGSGSPLPMSAQVLHPDASEAFDRADDRTLVLLIRAGPWRLLWLGDAGFSTEKRLLEHEDDLRCDVLIRNQHATDLSGLPELVEVARPQVVISSNDRWLLEEKMPSALRRHCQEEGIPLFDLAECGSVSIGITAAEVRLEGFANGQQITITPRDPVAGSAGR